MARFVAFIEGRDQNMVFQREKFISSHGESQYDIYLRHLETNFT